MSALMLALALASATPAPCSWNHPGANPFRGDVVEALNDYSMDSKVRTQLQAKMRLHEFDGVAMIRKAGVDDGHSGYTNLRGMHWGKNTYCPGVVDQSAWKADHYERGLVYCVGDVCVIVPTICNNVSLIDRKPVVAGGLQGGPIDISPAAGPTPVLPPEVNSSDVPPISSFGPGGYEPFYNGSEGGFGDDGGGYFIPPKYPHPPAMPPSCPASGPVIVPPVSPPVVPPVPPISPVPEPSTGILMILGLIVLKARKEMNK